MQNPGSDAGVFVWADGCGRPLLRSKHWHRSQRHMEENQQRHAEEKASRSLGYPSYAHGSANIRWCMLTNSKN